jgi:hypothetical protein
MKMNFAWTVLSIRDDLSMPLGVLRQDALRTARGQKIAYIVDIAYHQGNVQKAVALARDADHYSSRRRSSRWTSISRRGAVTKRRAKLAISQDARTSLASSPFTSRPATAKEGTNCGARQKRHFALAPHAVRYRRIPPGFPKTWAPTSSFIGPFLFIRFPDDRRLVVFVVVLFVLFVLVIIVVRVLRRQALKVRFG